MKIKFLTSIKWKKKRTSIYNKGKGGGSMLTKEDTVLVLVDIQGKLAKIVDESEFIIDNIVRVVKGANVLELPILWLEQYPKGLGPTVEEIANEIDELRLKKLHLVHMIMKSLYRS